jgi:hypothetical protein
VSGSIETHRRVFVEKQMSHIKQSQHRKREPNYAESWKKYLLAFEKRAKLS